MDEVNLLALVSVLGLLLLLPLMAHSRSRRAAMTASDSGGSLNGDVSLSTTSTVPPGSTTSSFPIPVEGSSPSDVRSIVAATCCVLAFFLGVDGPGLDDPLPVDEDGRAKYEVSAGWLKLFEVILRFLVERVDSALEEGIDRL